MPPLFSSVVIARNEAKCLPRLAASLQEFLKRGGCWIVVDTGSTDDTAEVAEQLGAKVTRVGDQFRRSIDGRTVEAVNKRFLVGGEPDILKTGGTFFDFASARNHAAALATCDYVSFADGDEAFTRLNIDAVDAQIRQGFGQFEYEFVFAHQADGVTPAVHFRQCKFYDRRALKWTGLIHENLVPCDKQPPEIRRTYLPESIFKLEHWQNRETDRSGYLRGLALAVNQNPADDRNSHYFGRELLWTGRYKSAIKELERHLQMGGWEAERSQSAIYIGEAHERLGNPGKALEWWHRAFDIHSHRREPFMKLAWHYFHKNDPQRAACYANAALLIPQSDHYANEAGHYENEPHEILMRSLCMLGDRDTARQHFDKADSYRPGHYLTETANFYSYINNIEGWMSPQELNFLHDSAKKMKSIIEIGSWKGRSTHALLTGAQPCGGVVTAVDHFGGSTGEDWQHAEAKTEVVFETFKKNVGSFPNLNVRRSSSEEAAQQLGSAEMIFVDAGHSYEDCKKDLLLWKGKATKLLCGHDYCDAWPGVKRAVDEVIGRIDGVAGSIWYKFVERDVPVSVVEAPSSCAISPTDRIVLTEWTKAVREGGNFVFLKYSDGEQVALLPGLGDKNGGRNVDGSHYSAELGPALLQAYQDVLGLSDAYLGNFIPHVTLTDIQQGGDPTCQAILRDYWNHVVPALPALEAAHKVSSGLLLHHKLTFTPELRAFYMAVRETERRVVYVGPAKLSGVVSFFNAYRHIVVPEHDAFLERDRIVREMREAAQTDAIFLVSAGMAAKVLIADLFDSENGWVLGMAGTEALTAIDLGSAFDNLYVGKTRTDQMSTEECRRLYPEIFDPAFSIPTALCELALKYRSDKVPALNHTYTPTYNALFKDRRDTVKKVLEIGIGFPETMPVNDYRVGASLFMWRDYFPNAAIYACDIREDILINEDRIQSYKVDQGQSGELFNLVEEIGGDFDLIVDDGSHLPDHQVISAVALVPFLAKGGKYIIEDIRDPQPVLQQLAQFGFACELLEFNPAAADDRMIVISAS